MKEDLFCLGEIKFASIMGADVNYAMRIYNIYVILFLALLTFAPSIALTPYLPLITTIDYFECHWKDTWTVICILSYTLLQGRGEGTTFCILDDE